MPSIKHIRITKVLNGYVKTRRNTLRRNERARRAGSCAIKTAAIFSMKKQKSIER